MTIMQKRLSLWVLGWLALSPQLAAASTTTIHIHLDCKDLEIPADSWTGVAKHAFSSRPDVAFEGEGDKLTDLQRAKVKKLNVSGIRGAPVGSAPSRSEVILTVLVESDGKVSDFVFEKRSKRAVFNEVTEATAEGSIYSPAMLRGVAVPSIASLSCTFDVQ